ncbi:hypothetical protein SAMD00019534_036420 [Acytostelium subglobosum LB1]|uniref:hypothetical protein n=1 Tax=Acytostelium subglobosum LB1 TaxID=1410327 RepID=UPI000644836E|nr:hypothetical protein SAMD00019534_036420 [Acytostelium subglobosum LB1]GAM20466.1 hypothetical protein SAMD00019534_036420 [Acytostelium subglobosum LB1]|eukprot:XP_012759987.1 hypothetical protein SAMD00019534_036420 [Acytostelium subglobosum LB1]
MCQLTGDGAVFFGIDVVEVDEDVVALCDWIVDDPPSSSSSESSSSSSSLSTSIS